MDFFKSVLRYYVFFEDKMEILTFFAPLSNNPGALFIGGVILGYGLKALQSSHAVKKPKRYSGNVHRHTRGVSNSKFEHEPSFEWSDSVVESLAKRPPFENSNEICPQAFE
jgi:hypothetical protein